MYLEVELKASIRSYRFSFCEGLHEVPLIAEQKQISNKGAQFVPIGIPTFCL